MNVCPTLKKSLFTETCNYRPIRPKLTSLSLMNHKSIVKDRVVHFLETNNHINTSQHTFRRGRSCAISLFDFYDYVFSEGDRLRDMDAVFLDFRKPFAMVLHKRLMIINVRALIIQCLDWELTGRKEAESHRLIVNGVPSDCTAIHSGVPERVTLGSPPFVIIVNDLDLVLSSKVSKFIDDTKLGIVRALRRGLAAIWD